jgi:hypothetical protein
MKLADQLAYLNKNTTDGVFAARGNPVLVRGNENHPDRLLLGITLSKGENRLNEVLREFVDYQDDNTVERLDYMLDYLQYNLMAWG